MRVTRAGGEAHWGELARNAVRRVAAILLAGIGFACAARPADAHSGCMADRARAPFHPGRLPPGRRRQGRSLRRLQVVTALPAVPLWLVLVLGLSVPGIAGAPPGMDLPGVPPSTREVPPSSVLAVPEPSGKRVSGVPRCDGAGTLYLLPGDLELLRSGGAGREAIEVGIDARRYRFVAASGCLQLVGG